MRSCLPEGIVLVESARAIRPLRCPPRRRLPSLVPLPDAERSSHEVVNVRTWQ
jgi:hypothetical protein